MTFIKPEALAALPPITENDDSAEEPTDVAVAMDETPLPAEDAPPASVEETPETPDAPPAGEPEVPAPDATAQELEDYRLLRDAWEKNAVGYLKAMSEKLTDAEKAELGWGQPQSEEPADEEGWTDEDMYTSADFFVREHRQEIAALPQLREALANELNTAGHYISELAYQNAVLEAQVALLLEHSDLKLPEIKRDELLKGQGGKSYREILNEKYIPEAKKTLGAKRAREAAQANLPTTPRNSAPDDENPLFTPEENLSPSKPGRSRLNDHLAAARAAIAQSQRR